MKLVFYNYIEIHYEELLFHRLSFLLTVYGYLILKQSKKGLRKIKQSQRVEIPSHKKIPVKKTTYLDITGD